MAAKAQRTYVFGQLLRALRDDALKKRTSLRSAEVATAATIRPLTHTAFRNYEEGRVPGLPQIHALASAYGVRWENLAAALLENLRRDDATLPQLLAIAKPAERRHEPNVVEVGTPEGSAEFVSVPVLAGRIAAGSPLVIDEQEIVNYVAFSPSVIKRLSVSRPLAVRVGRRERSMYPTIRADDTVLLDCSDARRESPRAGRIYAVNIDEGTTLKRVSFTDDVLTLIADNLDKDEYPVRTIELFSGLDMKSLIVGEAVWWGNALL